MDHLSALDAAFVELEDDHVALHIGSAAVFDGPAPATSELIGRYERFVARHTRYRQVLSRARWDLRRPEWLDAVAIDFDYHVRRTALPAPGEMRELETLVGRIMSTRLDPDRPLWETWIVEGLSEGRWALVIKVHHSIVDGVGGMATMLDLFDHDEPAPRPRARTTAPRISPQRAESPVRLVGRVSRRVVSAGERVVRVPVAVSRSLPGLPTGLRTVRFTPPTSLNGELGKARRFRTLTVERAEIDAVRETFGGTVNDVVLAMVAQGFHRLLTTRLEKPVPGAVRCMVPVNVRKSADAASEANKITVMLVDLPVEFPDVRDAYVALRARVHTVKKSSTGQVVKTGFALADRVPSPAASAFLAAVRRVPQRIITTICTNVPGPRSPQSLLGRRLVALYPYVPIGDRVRVAVAVTSYQDSLHFGVTCDRKSVRDADVFVAALSSGLRDLAKHA